MSSDLPAVYGLIIGFLLLLWAFTSLFDWLKTRPWKKPKSLPDQEPAAPLEAGDETTRLGRAAL